MAAGVLQQSQFLSTFAPNPCQYELALALREIGRTYRTLFIIDCLFHADMQRRVNVVLNKGVAHHAFKKIPCALVARVESAIESPSVNTTAWLV